MQFEPSISRLFVLVAVGTTIVIIYTWRNLFYFALTRTNLLDRVKQRVAVLGSDARARAFLEEIAPRRVHPFAAIGAIGAPGETPPPDATAPDTCWLGSFAELENALTQHQIDVL